ncbi:hypothetical protein WN51_03638, partial [Melipona quadrifasciata]
SENVLITFEGSVLPEKIQLYGLLRKTITPYIESVKTCRNCYKYGHVTKFSRSPKTCINCGQATRDKERNCQAKATKYLHCRQDYSTFENNCIRIRTNKEVNTIPAYNDVSVYEAMIMAKNKLGV